MATSIDKSNDKFDILQHDMGVSVVPKDYTHTEEVTTSGTVSYRTYTVNNAIAFGALELPLPPNSMIFWGEGRAPGILLLNRIHYLTNGSTFVLGSIMLGVGDTITVVTFT